MEGQEVAKVSGGGLLGLTIDETSRSFLVVARGEQRHPLRSILHL